MGRAACLGQFLISYKKRFASGRAVCSYSPWPKPAACKRLSGLPSVAGPALHAARHRPRRVSTSIPHATCYG